MPSSARGRALLAAGLVALLFLAGLGVVALSSLQRRSELLLQRVETDATERGARRARWQVLVGVAPDGVRQSLAQPEPRVALSRQLQLWSTEISLGLIVFDPAGKPLASAPPELLEESPRLTGADRVSLDIAHADGTPAATISGVPMDALDGSPALSPSDLRLFDPLLLSFLAAITLAVLALLAFLVYTTNRLERAEALRRSLMADAGHELRTPLTNLRCQIEAIQDGLQSADAATVRSLHEETLLLSRLVTDLQDLAMAEAGRLPLHRAKVDVAEVVDAAIASLRPLAGERRIALHAEVPATIAVNADRERLGQVLRNLLSNAVTHTPESGAVTVTARGVGSAIEIAVHDTGPGIAPEHLPRVFDRFYRADPSRARATGGSGLGLAIVKQLVEAHGGEVRAESRPGHGAVFTFTLPAS
jgi:signal transduction histidine kinase